MGARDFLSRTKQRCQPIGDHERKSLGRVDGKVVIVEAISWIKQLPVVGRATEVENRQRVETFELGFAQQREALGSADTNCDDRSTIGSAPLNLMKSIRSKNLANCLSDMCFVELDADNSSSISS